MTTLEKIRAEIKNQLFVGRILNSKDFDDGLKWCLEIIDKYAEQEPNRDMEEIEGIMKSDADAETKCKMISNILTAKPHYFTEQEPCEDDCQTDMDEAWEQAKREEAVKYLIRPIVTSTEVGKEKQKEIDAYNMAIKALEQEPCEDAVSRSTAKTRVYLKYIGKPKLCKEIFAILDELPSVQPKQKEGAE